MVKKGKPKKEILVYIYIYITMRSKKHKNITANSLHSNKNTTLKKITI